MPKIHRKSVSLCQVYWHRVTREFCDACGMVIRDPYFYKWMVTHLDGSDAWVDLAATSHVNNDCVGQTIKNLLGAIPAEPHEQQNKRSILRKAMQTI